MEVSVTARSIEFIPDWNKNKDDPKPVRMRLRFLNSAQRMTLLPWHVDDKGNATMDPDRRGLILAGVERIDDLMVTEDGERKEIRTGRALLEAFGCEALAIETATKLIMMNARDVEKNS